MDWKKNEKTFQSGNFEQTEKVREFHPKYWNNDGILTKNTRKMRIF